jgi:chemotaxis protein methyltransferase CheR
MDDSSFEEVLQFFNLSWEGYRRVRKGVKRRISQHMQELGCRNTREYLYRLSMNPEEMERAREYLTVSISRFFRDRKLWETMGRAIVPELIQNCRPSAKIWSAGCAGGEEIYSLKILWNEVSEAFPGAVSACIWATDMNRDILRRASMGVFTPSSLKEVSRALRDKYFTKVEDRYTVSGHLKEGIHWMLHDFVSEDPPAAMLDLIFLRNNLLTYYEQPLRNQTLSKIVDVLKVGGYLIVGNKEHVPVDDFPLQRFPEYRCILVKSSTR